MILDAAVELFDTRPNAGLEEVAATAGVSRQTVYSHFGSREELVAAAVDRVGAEVLAAIDAVDDAAPAADALVSLLAASWQAFRHHRLLLAAAERGSGRDDRHAGVVDRLEAVLRRGRREGAFDRDLEPAWAASAVIALGHAAGERVLAGEVDAAVAEAQLTAAVLRLVAR